MRTREASPTDEGSLVGIASGRRLERRTLSLQIYSILEQRILDGTLPPGAQLSEEALAVAYGVSRAPAREAIMELERAGLAGRSGHRDRIVAIPTEEMIAQQYEVWWIVDSGRTYLASLEATHADHGELRSFIDGMAEGIRRKDPAMYRTNCDAFHQKIRQSCRNTALRDIGYGCDLYIRWFEALYDRDPDPSPEAVSEHYSILSAYERQSFEDLATTIRAHILRQRSRILTQFKAVASSLQQATGPDAGPIRLRQRPGAGGA